MTEKAAIDSRASLGLSFDTPAKTLGAHRLAPVRRREDDLFIALAHLGCNALNTDRGTLSNMNGAAVGHGSSDRQLAPRLNLRTRSSQLTSRWRASSHRAPLPAKGQKRREDWLWWSRCV